MSTLSFCKGREAWAHIGVLIDNYGSMVNGSGTVGAACEGSFLGIPSIAFSAPSASLSQDSFTTLTTDPNSSDSINALLYASLTTKLVASILNSGASTLVPRGTILNVNFPAVSSSCNTLGDFEFVFSRVSKDNGTTDAKICGSDHLPVERAVVHSGCFVSISVLNSTVGSKKDVDAATQASALPALKHLPLTCLP